MDLIKMARDLGHALQNEPVYLKYREYEKICDEDIKLQELISEFNLKRIALNNESSKGDDKDSEKMIRYNKEMREAYANVMKNENMAKLQDAKIDFDGTVQRILAIITNSSRGEDPDTTDLSSCSHDCRTCSGCC